MKLNIETDQAIKSISIQVEFYESGEVKGSEVQPITTVTHEAPKEFGKVEKSKVENKQTTIATEDVSGRSPKVDQGIGEINI